MTVPSSQRPFKTSDGIHLNIECFSTDDDDEKLPTFLFIHGVCESAETWGVQSMAKACVGRKWRLLVLELAGHGLSQDLQKQSLTGSRDRGRAVCPDFGELRDHVVEFCLSMMTTYPKSRGFVLAGGSLGGSLVAYAARGIIDGSRKEVGSPDRPALLGIALIAPALGVDKRAVPPPAVVMALKAASYLVPGLGLMTPEEDPRHYACPPNSSRNFSGRWPLATAGMLLDVTSKLVPRDVESKRVDSQLEGLKSLLVLAGERDQVVPLACIKEWYHSINCIAEDEKKLHVLEGGDHGFLHDHPNAAFVDILFDWCDRLVQE
ncbi:hypothetical protein THAOC_05757 [Thalassiosira oceanica]|uniref:AB hydrolase-1 domain-containing protein n=1 Tax=Thalassiosira oceanica TaxID=159749 RepID=K0TMH8_THAOC|nr:hypothetical protein THAOC_05757 [Thalassiosira oceanica]|eukprot:EJK72687.1 hypothetical protein THAOC_05757 [Thalassiosira oceanica]